MITSIDIFSKNCLFLLTNPDSTINWSSASNMLSQFFFLIFSFAIIVLLIVSSFKITAKVKKMSGLNSNIRVIESRILSFNNYIHLVKVGEKYYLLGTSKTSVEYLTEVDKSGIIDNYDNPRSMDFSKLLKDGINKAKKEDVSESASDNSNGNNN